MAKSRRKRTPKTVLKLPDLELSLAKIKSAFKINDIRRGCVTCYMDDIQTSRSFGEGQHTVAAWQATFCSTFRAESAPHGSSPRDPRNSVAC